MEEDAQKEKEDKKKSKKKAVEVADENKEPEKTETEKADETTEESAPEYASKAEFDEMKKAMEDQGMRLKRMEDVLDKVAAEEEEGETTDEAITDAEETEKAETEETEETEKAEEGKEGEQTRFMEGMKEEVKSLKASHSKVEEKLDLVLKAIHGGTRKTNQSSTGSTSTIETEVRGILGEI